MANCSWCRAEMPEERLELYSTCIKCTGIKPYAAVQVFEHKTAGYPVLINSGNSEQVRQANNYNKRKR